MKQHYEVVGISSDRNYLEHIGESQGISVYAVEMTRKITPWQDLKAVWNLYNYFKKEKPFIVHTHTPKAGTLGMLAAIMAGVPHRLHTIAGLPLMETTGFKRLVLNFVEKITYSCATHIYPNSHGLKEIVIQEQFCKPEKLKVIGNGSSNGINSTHFNPDLFPNIFKKTLKANIGIAPEDFVYVFVGRMVGDKGINELIRAFKKLSIENAKAKLLLVGSIEPKLDPLLPETLKEIRVNKAIISVGFQKDVRPYFAVANVLVFPSYREGFPNVVMQAGAMGLPSIVTDINGCNEIVVQGQNGVIIPVKNSEALQKAMEIFLEDKKKLKQMSANARLMIVDRYEQKVVWEAILAEYKSFEVAQPLEIKKNKLIRTSTVAISLDYLLKGQLSFLQKDYEVLAVSGYDYHLNKVAARERVRTRALVMRREINPFKDLKSLWQLYWLFKKEKPLIVHSITPKAGLLSMMAAYFARVPIRIHTFTGLIFPSKSGVIKQLLIVMDKVLCRCATNIYPEGQGVRQDLITYKITKKSLKVIANGNVNGIDVDYFNQELFPEEMNQNFKNILGITTKDFVFIFIGRLVGDKGINELVAAFELFSINNKQQITPKLLLVGSFESNLDPLQKETLQLINNNKSIYLVGFQEDVRPYLAVSDCLVFPSYREGFPNVVMQAGAMGLPSIVTNINGCNEIIVEGENGTVIPVKNVDALSQAMRKMMEDNAFRTQLQQKARPMIVSRYEQLVVWEAILAEYKRLEHDV
nr:glycosyltransferase family 4 protein [uncultured Flavobacterium sp.]